MPEAFHIEPELIEHLGRLAHIRLDSARREELRGKLQQLVAAFSALAEADFGDAADDAGGRATLTPDRLRPDDAETPPAVADVLANAPRTAADCFVVPRVVDA